MRDKIMAAQIAYLGGEPEACMYRWTRRGTWNILLRETHLRGKNSVGQTRKKVTRLTRKSIWNNSPKLNETTRTRRIFLKMEKKRTWGEGEECGHTRIRFGMVNTFHHVNANAGRSSGAGIKNDDPAEGEEEGHEI